MGTKRTKNQNQTFQVWTKNLVMGPMIMGTIMVTSRRAPDSLPNALMFHS